MVLMCGVCEGFYGKPWSTEERKGLFKRMKRFGMNTYLYAPKDDYKHRLYWRKLYSSDEIDDLKTLIELAKANNVNFVYALSPGLDIMFSYEEDIACLKAKLLQLKNLGCESFSLLFDDIDADLCHKDAEQFASSGDAQASITNQMYDYLGKPQVFLFCPTEYCSSRAEPDLVRSEYLRTIGKKLNSGIDILWTGNKVVSKYLKLESIIEVEEVLQRPPTIWDNLHANDYDQTRIYFGPYDGRPNVIKEHLRGVLTNPNCELEANFVAMHTLAQWGKDAVQRFPILNESGGVDEPSSLEPMDVDGKQPPGYHPKKALCAAVLDWLPEFYRPKDASGYPINDKAIIDMIEKRLLNVDTDGGNSSSADDSKTGAKIEKAGNNDADDSSMQVDSDQGVVTRQQKEKEKRAREAKEIIRMESDDDVQDDNSNKSDKDENKDINMKKKNEDIDPLNEDDLLLLCDLFYLPFEHGPRSIYLLKRAHWLVTNLDRLKNVQRGPFTIADQTPDVKEWYERAVLFHEAYKDLVVMVDKFVNIPNRRLLYDFYPYVSDMRSAVGLVNSFIKWNGLGKPDKEPFRGGEQEPWVHRGGLHSEFRRLLPLEGQKDTFPQIKTEAKDTKLLTVRPYFDSDRDDVYTVCRQTCDDGMDGSDIFPNHPDLPADEAIGGLLELYPEYCYVIEDTEGVCGYAVAAPDVVKYQQALVDAWLPKMRIKYPDACPDKKDHLTVIEEVIKTFHCTPCPIPGTLHKDYPAFMHASALHSRLDEVAPIKRLVDCVIKVLKRNGIIGVHSAIHATHLHMLTFYMKLGLDNVTDEKSTPENLVILGAKI